ncbi:hypothetical protein CRUP_009079 [Coryphaenoides rupestris]|nr:hypothetical protein CRUP_009079 [Coryphaenoides rupestris]
MCFADSGCDLVSRKSTLRKQSALRLDMTRVPGRDASGVVAGVGSNANANAWLYSLDPILVTIIVMSSLGVVLGAVMVMVEMLRVVMVVVEVMMTAVMLVERRCEGGGPKYGHALGRGDGAGGAGGLEMESVEIKTEHCTSGRNAGIHQRATSLSGGDESLHHGALPRVRWRSRLSSRTVSTGSTPGAAMLDDQWAYWKHWEELWYATDSWLFLAAR